MVGRHYSDAIYQLSRGLRRRAYLGLESLVNRRASAIVAPSAAVARVLLAQGVDPAKVEVIPYGFDFARFAPRAEAALFRVRGEWPAGTGPRLVMSICSTGVESSCCLRVSSTWRRPPTA